MSASQREVKVNGGADKGGDATPRTWGYRGNYKPTMILIKEPKFEGKCDSVKGFTYDFLDGKQSDRYNLVSKEIAEYVGRGYTYGSDVRWIIHNE
jgi:hypothetical protein